MEIKEESVTFVQSNTIMSKKVPPIDENRLKSNPFTESLKVYVNERIDTVATVKDEDGKEAPMVCPMEWTKSTKVFHNKDAGDEALSLSSGALRMYVYIIHKMESAQDWLRIMPENYAIKSDRGSINSYKRAVNELIDKKYICLSPFKYTYYINPYRIFCGSRIQKYPNNLHVKGKFKGTDQGKKKPNTTSEEWLRDNEPK